MKTNHLQSQSRAKQPAFSFVLYPDFQKDRWFLPSEIRTFWKCVMIIALIWAGVYSHTHRPKTLNHQTKCSKESQPK